MAIITHAFTLTGLNKMTKQGKLKWYNHVKGYGFISRDEGQKDIFCHVSYLLRTYNFYDVRNNIIRDVSGE